MLTEYPKIPKTSVEIVEPPVTGKVRHVLLDFDGTLSMIRDGWQDAMVPMMVEVLKPCSKNEPVEALKALVIDFVDHLTGKQTIYQMIRLAEEVAKRGGSPLDPLEYKNIYNQRFRPVVQKRISELRSGKARPDDLMVGGARELLEELRRRGVTLYVASGTDIEFVREEAAVLAIDHYFNGGIFGALPNYQDFSKEKVIRKILADFHLEGPELLVIGDGYVEIENARRVSAIAVGLVSEESNRYHMNADKRERLLRAGAHLLAAPDFRDARGMLEYLLKN
ncbi:MAG: haloacid dehalogenase-like hydrolase [Planctomycetes bacterium]|nr:haloacid dehalogenase-like hydrolase [Planctomycetota bacterium]